ncbi:MAG TPA: LysR substrate-binding domain-containing protein [Rhizomicrobium sp.]|nr:LysR substrate-binding domain-containing protein [Rhizomicrobium sp.]
MDWDKLRIFHAVASAGSFTHAGQMLALSQSAVSRQISALEEDLVTPLFQRHARGLTLTDEGELLYGAVSDVLSRLAQAEEALKNVQEAPRGQLKVTSSHGLGTYWLLPRLEGFLAEFPEIEIRLIFEDRELDLAQREADLALRMRAPVQADLIQRKLFTVRYHTCATQDYLDKHGTPQVFDDLLHHRLIAYGESAAPEIRDVNWLIESTRRLKQSSGPRTLRINNFTGILHSVEAGMGIAAIPDYIAAERKQLVRVLPEVDGPTFDVHLVYCDALRHSKRVAAFRDFLVRSAREWKF